MTRAFACHQGGVGRRWAATSAPVTLSMLQRHRVSIGREVGTAAVATWATAAVPRAWRVGDVAGQAGQAVASLDVALM